jgi:hypothetical protein
LDKAIILFDVIFDDVWRVAAERQAVLSRLLFGVGGRRRAQGTRRYQTDMDIA